MTFLEMLEEGGKVNETDFNGYLVLTPHMCREVARQLGELVARIKELEAKEVLDR